jgi:hypothetical protein
VDVFFRFQKIRKRLFAPEAVAAGALRFFAGAGVAHVNFRKGAIVAFAVELAFGNAAADAGVDIVIIFVHHR